QGLLGSVGRRVGIVRRVTGLPIIRDPAIDIDCAVLVHNFDSAINGASVYCGGHDGITATDRLCIVAAGILRPEQTMEETGNSSFAIFLRSSTASAAAGG